MFWCMLPLPRLFYSCLFLLKGNMFFQGCFEKKQVPLGSGAGIARRKTLSAKAEAANTRSGPFSPGLSETLFWPLDALGRFKENGDVGLVTTQFFSLCF